MDTIGCSCLSTALMSFHDLTFLFHGLKSTDVDVEQKIADIADRQVRADIPEQNYGGNVQIYCMLPKAGPMHKAYKALMESFKSNFNWKASKFCVFCVFCFVMILYCFLFRFLYNGRKVIGIFVIGSLWKFGNGLHCLQFT